MIASTFLINEIYSSIQEDYFSKNWDQKSFFCREKFLPSLVLFLSIVNTRRCNDALPEICCARLLRKRLISVLFIRLFWSLMKYGLGWLWFTSPEVWEVTCGQVSVLPLDQLGSHLLILLKSVLWSTIVHLLFLYLSCLKCLSTSFLC